MIKLKAKVRNNKIIVNAKISSNLVINTNQCELLSEKCSYGFLKLSKAKKNKLEFTGPVGKSLYDRLKEPISEYDFFFLMEQIGDMVQKLGKIGLSYEKLVLDLNFVFFHEPVKELSFIYLPIADFGSSTEVLSFIEQIIYLAKPAEKDLNYLSDFGYFIKKLDKFDAAKIEAYICRFHREIVNIIKSDNLSIEEKEQAAGDELTGILEDDEQTDFMDDDSTDIFQEESDETALFQKEKAVYKPPTLVRVLTEEVIRIDKPVFRIGREEACVDYAVANNTLISRSHADIITRSERYFVFDLRSKNKSYLNNNILPSEQEVEIFNGDVLKFANEEFYFKCGLEKE